MNDLAHEVAGLRMRLRLQMMVVIGVVIIGLLSLGGADVVARVLVDSDSWILRTNNLAGTPTPRITVTTGENNVRVKFGAAHLELAPQPTSPSSPAEGALWYDSTAKKMKFYNGSAWVESGGGGVIGGSVVENDAWRLEYTNSSTITLVGTGNGGGTININGTLYGFATNPTKGCGGLPTGLVHRVYAYWTGSALDLEITQTQATKEEYGVYANKNADPSRRFVGLCVPMPGGGPIFVPELVRSARNEQGYCFMKKYSASSGYEVGTSSTSWQDLDSNVAKDGLFFSGEHIRVWCMAMDYVAPVNTSRYSRLGVSFGGTAVEDSESSSIVNRGSSYAVPFSTHRAEAYVTNLTAGLRSVKAIHKTVSGSNSNFWFQPEIPASIGFEVQR